jgi:hypothetical protein
MTPMVIPKVCERECRSEPGNSTLQQLLFAGKAVVKLPAAKAPKIRSHSFQLHRIKLLISQHLYVYWGFTDITGKFN